MHSVRVAIYDGKSSFCVFVRVSLCVFFLTSRTVFFLSDLCAFYMLFGSCWSCIIGFLFVLTSSSLRVAMSCMLVSFVFLRFVILTYILFFVGVILFYWVSIGGERGGAERRMGVMAGSIFGLFLWLSSVFYMREREGV